MSERLHKILAQHGLGSRREVERWIVEGRLLLNGRAAQLGDRYNEGDRVQLDGKDVSKRLQYTAAPQVLAYHKPQGQALDREQGNANANEELKVSEGETVQDRLPAQRGVRWIPINPMHPGDSGLLLFTNDGALGYALTRHKKQIPAVYMVRVYVRGGANAAPVLPTKLRLDDETIDFLQVELTNSSGGEGDSETDNVWYKVALARADKRAAVRALFVSHGLTISRMMQVSFAGIELGKELPRSRHQLLKPAQVAVLYQAAELQPPQDNRSQRHDDHTKRRAKSGSIERARPGRNTTGSNTVRASTRASKASGGYAGGKQPLRGDPTRSPRGAAGRTRVKRK